jgi:hypothetical protein
MQPNVKEIRYLASDQIATLFTRLRGFLYLSRDKALQALIRLICTNRYFDDLALHQSKGTVPVVLKQKNINIRRQSF